MQFQKEKHSKESQKKKINFPRKDDFVRGSRLKFSETSRQENFTII